MNDERPHVLVIDDDNRLRDLLGKFLGEHGFLVVTASDAADARDKMTLFAFDIIVLDLMMPGENGLDFAEDLRRRSKIPILMLTAMGAPEDRIVGFEKGVADYLSQPFEPREVLFHENEFELLDEQGKPLRRVTQTGTNPGGLFLRPCTPVTPWSRG